MGIPPIIDMRAFPSMRDTTIIIRLSMMAFRISTITQRLKFCALFFCYNI
jgi:hypothetical protein